MKHQKSCGPRLGKLVHQLPKVVTFAYDLRFRRVIAHWKGIIEEIHFGGLRTSISKNLHLGPQNGPGSENLLKIVNCQNGQKTVLSHLEKVGGPRYPPGSWLHLVAMVIITKNFKSDCNWFYGCNCNCNLGFYEETLIFQTSSFENLIQGIDALS